MAMRIATAAIENTASNITQTRWLPPPAGSRYGVVAGVGMCRLRLPALEPGPLDVHGEPEEVRVLPVHPEPLEREGIVVPAHRAVDRGHRRQKARLLHHVPHRFVEVADTASVRIREVQDRRLDLFLDQRPRACDLGFRLI